VKLLLDQNLSSRLVPVLQDVHAGSAHVRQFGMQTAADGEIWEFARDEDFVIASKDSDFRQLGFLRGPPPKVVWLRLGNCTTDRILAVLLGSRERMLAFEADDDAALLVLT
jgi:predicted nuclease of predicted toxin-antitoxin system